MPGVTGRDARPLEGVEENGTVPEGVPGRRGRDAPRRFGKRTGRRGKASPLGGGSRARAQGARDSASTPGSVPFRGGRVRAVQVPALRFPRGGVRRGAPRREAPPTAGGARVDGDPRRQPHPPERGFRRGGPGTRRGGPPAAQPPERRSRPQRSGSGGDAEAPVRGRDPGDPGGRPCYSRGRGVLQLPGRGRLVMRGALRSLILILLTAGCSVAAFLADRFLPGGNRRGMRHGMVGPCLRSFGRVEVARRGDGEPPFRRGHPGGEPPERRRHPDAPVRVPAAGRVSRQAGTGRDPSVREGDGGGGESLRRPGRSQRRGPHAP